MENNFHLKTRLHHNDLHIHLHGSFNGSSACELVRTLQHKSHISKSVFIDTTHVTRTFPFGRAVLEAELPKKGLRRQIHFTGNFARDIMPEGCILLNGNVKKKHACNGNCKNCLCSKPSGNK